MEPFADNFIPVVPVDYTEHTVDRPFCSADQSCGCHEDSEPIIFVSQAVEDGILTPEEATNFVNGKLI